MSSTAVSTFRSRHLDTMRWRHVAFMVWGIPVLTAAAALIVVPRRAPGLPELVVFLAMYTVGAIGIGVGYHRLITHRAFKTRPWVTRLLASMGSVAGQGPIVYWAALHRLHHSSSDQEEDPHSPWKGFGGPGGGGAGLWHAHIGWMFTHGIPNPSRWAKDLLKAPEVQGPSKAYPLLFLLGLLVPGALVGLATWSPWGFASGVLWGGLFRVLLGQHVIWSINSICHRFGMRAFETHDLSVNNGVLALPSFGESWHNNHHAAPASAFHGLEPWQVDLSGLTIRALRAVGLADDVKVAGEHHLEKSRGDRYRSRGQIEWALPHYERALDLYNRDRLYARAAATARLIVDLDPSRAAVFDRLTLPAGAAPDRVTGDPSVAQQIMRSDVEHSGAFDADADPPSVETSVRLGSPVRVSEAELADREDEGEQDRESPPNAQILARLPAWPLFASVPQPIVARLVSAASLVELAPGSLLIRKGDAADALYVLVEGSVRIRVDGEPLVLSEGDVVGEACIVEREPRNADVVVAQSVSALRIPREALAACTVDSPELGEVLMELFVRRRLRHFLRTSPLFRAMDHATRSVLSERFEARLVAAGTPMVQRGARAAGLAVPLSGAFRVVDDDRTVDEIRPGDLRIVGWDSVVHGKEPRFDVVCGVDMAVLWMPVAAFAAVSQQFPDAVKGFEENRQRLLSL